MAPTAALQSFGVEIAQNSPHESSVGNVGCASKYDNMLSRLSNESPWSEANEVAVLEPFTYITANPGKSIRGLLIEGFNQWLNVPEDKLKVIGKIVKMLHNASLLVDDIEDDSELRRGEPVAHKIYGIPQTINTANYVYFLAYQELFSLRNARGGFIPPKSKSSESHGRKRFYSEEDVDHIVISELLSLHRGQGLELLWRDMLQCPTEDQYVNMVNDKTGGLFRIAVKLMMAYATTNADIDFIPLVNLMGVYFQIRDDYMNLQSEEYSANKGFAEDLTEGKFSFPIIHGIRTDPSNRQIIDILQKRPTEPFLKHHVISCLRSRTKSFDYTLGVLRKLEKQGRDEIGRLGGNAVLEAIIDRLHIQADGR